MNVTITALCQAVGQKPSPGSCPEDGKVGGCISDDAEDGLYSNDWYYTGTLADISCSSDETKVDGDGNPLDTDSSSTETDTTTAPVCSNTTPGNEISFSVVNNTANTVSIYWSDTSCAQTLYGTVEAGKTYAQSSSYVGHAWVVREGASSTGTILWQHVLTDADNDASFSIE